MASNPEIVVQYTANTAALNKGLKNVGKANEGFSKSMRKVGIVAGAAFAAVSVGIGKTIKDASNLNESVNAVQQVFGKAAGKVQEFSKTAATEAGLSMRQFNELVTPVGASLINVGYSADQAAEASIQLTKRAADMASVFNTSVPDALAAVQAGLRGEADPLERYGVGLSDAAVKAKAMALGLAESEKALTAQDKAQARVALTLEQTNSLAGDFVNTSSGLANSQRIISAEFENISARIGGMFLPIIAQATTSFAGFLKKFDEAPTASAKVRVVLDTLRTTVTNLAKTAADEAGKVWKALSDAVSRIDWRKLGAKVADDILAGLKTLNTLIRGVEWSKAGEHIGKAIADGADKFFKGTDWKQVFLRAAQIALAAKEAWDSLTRGMALLLVNAGKVAGIALGKGVLDGVDSMGNAIEAKAKQIANSVRAAIASYVSQHYSIGVQMIQGLIGGIQSMAGQAASAAANVVRNAVDSAKKFLHIGSPSKLWASLGVDSIEGYILGITDSTPKLKGKTAEAMQAALDAARAVVERQQDLFRASFAKLGDLAGRAFQGRTETILGKITRSFDAAIGRWQAFADAATPAEKALADIQKAEDERARSLALAAARAAVAAASSDQEMAAAQEQLRQANLANTIAALEEQARQERLARQTEANEHIAALTAQREREIQNQTEIRNARAAAFDQQLQDLQERLAKHPEEYDKVQKQILALFKRYGISYKKAGSDLGEAFANGLRASENAVEAAAKHLATVVARYLPHSPAEKGPLARTDFFVGFGKTLANNMLRGTGAVTAAANRLAGAAVVGAGGGLAAPTMLASGGAPVEVRVFIGDTELKGLVRGEVVTENNRLAQTLLGGVL